MDEESTESKKNSQEAIQYLDCLFNFANCPIIVWNTKLQITRFNKAFESLTGRVERDVIGKSIGILFPPVQRNRLMKLIKGTLEGNRLTVVEIDIQDINGSVHTLLWNSANIMSPDGITPIASIAQGHNITKRILADQKLLEKIKELAFQNEEKEKRASELLIANKELAFQNEEKEKRASELLIANKELAFQNEEKEKRASELLIANKELAFQNEEKEKRASELLIANKELVFQNEEKEKRASELLIAKEKAEELEIKFKQIAENIDEVFWLRSDSEMIYVSPSFEKIWGVPCQRVYDNPRAFTEKIHPEDRFAVEEIILSSEFKNKVLYNYEYRILREKNEVRWINTKSFPILDNSGQIIKRVGITSDITEKRESIEELILARKKAEESDKLKSAFLANMSHEIRTPMNGILGFADLLKEPNLTGEMQQKYIEIIEKSGLRMLNIINNIVDISKIEAGMMNACFKNLNVNEKIEFIYHFFIPETERKGIKLYINKTLPTKDAIIKSDGEKLFSILTNLVKNAIKYTQKGLIEIGYSLKNDKEPAELEFYVKDTGIGIPEDRQRAIFERFIQADILDIKAHQGAGLGLSISKAYVEMLNGKIWLESEVDKGSVFYFTLPYIKD